MLLAKNKNKNDELNLVDEISEESNRDFNEFDSFDFDDDLESESKDTNAEDLKEYLLNTDEVSKIPYTRSERNLFTILKQSTNYDGALTRDEFDSCFKSTFERDLNKDFDYDKLVVILMKKLFLFMDEGELSKIISAIYKLKENLYKENLIRYLNESEEYFSNEINNCVDCTNGMNNASRETIKQSSELFYKLARLTHKDLIRNLIDFLKK